MRYLLELCKEKKTAHLRRTLSETQDLLCIPLSFWEGTSHQTDSGGWWVRTLSEKLNSQCVECKQIWPALQGCTDCKVNPRRKQISPETKGARPKLQQTLGIVTVMRSALPEEIKKKNHNLISDSIFRVPHIQCCLEDMM